MLFVAVFSVAFLFGKSLRLDEAQTLWQTSHPLMGVLRILAQDVHVPLYFVAVRAWETLVGETPIAIRSFSLLCTLVSIPIFYALVRRMYGVTTAMMTIVLVISSPFLLWYSAEGRMYTLLLLLTVINHYAFFRLWTRGERSAYWPLYIFSLALGAMTHYFFLFIPLMQGIFFFTNRSLFARHAVRNFCFAAGIVLLEYGGWFFYRSAIGQINADPSLAPPTTVDVFNVFTNFLFGFQGEETNTMLLSLWPLAVLVACTLVAQRKKMQLETIYLVLSAFAPILITFGISVLVRPMFLSRYLIVTLPPLYILLAHIILSYRYRTASVLFVSLVLLMQASLFYEALSSTVSANEDYRDATSFIQSTIRSDDLLVLSAPFTRFPMEYYYRGSARLSTFPEWERYRDLQGIPPYDEANLARSLEQWKGTYTNLYVLTSYDQGYESSLRLYLDTHAQRIETREFSPKLTLLIYRLRYL